MRRRRILYAGLVFVCLWLLGSEVSVHASEPTADVEVFVRAGCPHCEAAKAFLLELRQRRPALHILVRDVGQDQTALTRLETLARRQAVTLIGVPAFYLQGEL
ncbi:MAG: NrdH-redoxin, partial [Nitrospira sp.]|nr:NrdH-redoxin [Nitrospira sp.]